MEPKLPAPQLGPEYPMPRYEQGHEAGRAETVEQGSFERGQERLEQRSEAPPAVDPVVTPVLPAPVAPTEPSVSTDNTVSDDTPLVANDDDLIEKEWVDKAKKIIVQTKDDPYAREQQVGKLQADYLRKRYGKELGASS